MRKFYEPYMSRKVSWILGPNPPFKQRRPDRYPASFLIQYPMKNRCKNANMKLLKKLERSSQSMILVTLAMRERLSFFSQYEQFLCLSQNDIRKFEIPIGIFRIFRVKSGYVQKLKVIFRSKFDFQNAFSEKNVAFILCKSYFY